MSTARLSMHGVHKAFGGLDVLADISLSATPVRIVPATTLPLAAMRMVDTSATIRSALARQLPN